MIEQARLQVAQAANSTLTLLYWHVGDRIRREVLRDGRAQYGQQILATLSQALRWSHFVQLLLLKQALEREFYAQMCQVERWSLRTLRERTASQLYLRSAIARKPEAVVKCELGHLREGGRRCGRWSKSLNPCLSRSRVPGGTLR